MSEAKCMCKNAHMGFLVLLDRTEEVGQIGSDITHEEREEKEEGRSEIRDT